MDVAIASYKLSFDTRPQGRKGLLQLRLRDGSKAEITLDAAQVAAVAAILDGPSPMYDASEQKVSSIRIFPPPAGDIAHMLVNPAHVDPFILPETDKKTKDDE